jgi:putative ABC transport system permease protein
MNSLLADFRFGLRMLSKQPAFTSIAIITLALGIGANTAIFSVVNAVLLRALPVAEPDRLVMVYEANMARGFNRGTVAPGNYLTWKAQQTAFEEIGAFVTQGFALAGNDGAEMLEGARLSANIFGLLRVAPGLGRVFTNEEDRLGGERVVILSHGLWRRRFGGAQDIVGQTITLDDKPCAIVGVMPEGFDFPTSITEIWAPAALDMERGLDGMTGRLLQVIARLKPQSTIEQARAEMGVITQGMAQANPNFNAGLSANIVPLREEIVSGWRRILLILFGVVACVLLISCANVANLLLARASTRTRETAIRVAMGASRLRIVRLLLMESLLLAGAGGVVGLLIGWWGVDALVALNPFDQLRESGVRMDANVAMFTFALTFLTGLLFGLAPALKSSKPDLNESLKNGGRGATAGSGLRSALVVSEIALSLILLVGAGLMVRSFLRLQSVDSGFDPRNLLTLRLSLPETRYPEAHQVINFYQQLTERLGRLPGVESVAATHALPLSGMSGVRPFTVEGRPRQEQGKAPIVPYRMVSPDYFRTMKIAFVGGRDFAKRDEGQAAGVVIINQAFQRRYFQGEDPIGKRITLGGYDDQWGEIVGVAGDVRHWGAEAEAQPEMYWAYSQAWLARSPTLSRLRRSLTLTLRAGGDPQNLIQDVRREVIALDKALPVTGVRTMEEWMGASLAGRRFNTLLISLFAALALILAVVGLYGVISYTVAECTREIGVRMALGAQTGDVLRLVIGQGMTLTLVGIGIGLLASFGLTRLMKDMLFEVGPTDPLTFAAIAVLLIAAALMACYIPARRATKVDPMVALRTE